MENNKHKKSGLKNQTAGYMLFQVKLLGNYTCHFEHFVRVAPLVVVPSANFYECAVELDTCLLIEDRGVGVITEVCRNNSLVGVSENALELALRSLFHSCADFLVCALFLELYSKVNERYVRCRNTERHTCKFAVELRKNLTYSLSSSC